MIKGLTSLQSVIKKLPYLQKSANYPYASETKQVLKRGKIKAPGAISLPCFLAYHELRVEPSIHHLITATDIIKRSFP